MNYPKLRRYLCSHGCSVCALTTLLTSRVTELKNFTPVQVITEIQASLFGNAYKRNFRRPLRFQMPVSMFGMTKIFEKYNLPYKYVYQYKDTDAITEITEHLQKGKPVMITLKRRHNDRKWAGSVHTMLLIGLDSKGRAVIADSATRNWSGNHQRIKYGDVSELVSYMWSSKEKAKTVYYSGRRGSSGYILFY